MRHQYLGLGMMLYSGARGRGVVAARPGCAGVGTPAWDLHQSDLSLASSDGSAESRSAVAAKRVLEFVPIGMFGRADVESLALITRPLIGVTPVVHPAAPPRAVAAMKTRSGLIEINLADGSRLRVDAFINERALRR